MSGPLHPLQTVAVPYGWEDGKLMIGLVTAYRSHHWTLPKISVGEGADAAEMASNEALRQGGYLGISDPEPLLTILSGKGVQSTYYAMEIHGVMDSWDANRTQSRKLVPVDRVEKFLHDRAAWKAIRTLLQQRIEVRLIEAPRHTPE